MNPDWKDVFIPSFDSNQVRRVIKWSLKVTNSLNTGEIRTLAEFWGIKIEQEPMSCLSYGSTSCRASKGSGSFPDKQAVLEQVIAGRKTCGI